MITLSTLALCTNLLCLKPPRFPKADAQEPARDAWFAEDKAKHLFTSFGATIFAFAGARAAGLDEDASVVASAAGGIALGIAKEINDARTGGDVSAKDLVVDLLGVGAAVLLARHAQ